MKRSWRNQFDLDWDISSIVDELSELGFTDSSWGNDVSPSFECHNSNIRVWIDYKDIGKREFSDGKLFMVELMDLAFHGIVESFESDEWELIKDKMEDYASR